MSRARAPQDVERFVAAECSGCGSVHLLEEREIDDTTTASTVCPECGCPEYTTAIQERGGEDNGEEVNREA